MMARQVFVLLPLLAVVAQQDPASFPITVKGDERLAWDQAADNDAQINTFRYVAYIDDNDPVEMTGASCARSSPTATFTCTAPLPTLSLGLHTIDIATAVKGSFVPSGRSDRLYLLVRRQVRSQQSARIDVDSTMVTSDDVRLTATRIVTGLADPVDLAFMPDGGLIVAERAGLLRVVRDDRLVSAAASSVFERRSEREQLLAVAVDPDFGRSHFVYAIYTTISQNQLAFCLARFREAAGTFADRMIIVDDVPAAPDGASAALRFGPDGKLFAAFDDGGRPQLASDWSSYNGKILRLNPDGTTPNDQGGYVPLYSSPYHSPRGLAWRQPGNMLWMVTEEADGGRLQAIASDSVQRRGVVQATVALPSATVPSGVAVYPSTGVIEAFRDNLLVASAEGRSLLRLRTDPLVPIRIIATEQLLDDRIGGVRAPVVGPDGAIYVATVNAIWKLSPSPGSVPRPAATPRREGQ